MIEAQKRKKSQSFNYELSFSCFIFLSEKKWPQNIKAKLI